MLSLWQNDLIVPYVVIFLQYSHLLALNYNLYIVLLIIIKQKKYLKLYISVD